MFKRNMIYTKDILRIGKDYHLTMTLVGCCFLFLLASCHHTTVSQLESKQEAGITDITSSVRGLMLESAGIALVLLIVTLLLARGVYRMEKGKWSGFWKSIERSLSGLFGLIWILGFCTYCVGMFIVEGPIDVCSWDSLGRLLRVAPMGVIHAFEMFLLESDISAIHGKFHDNLYFMTWFSVVHFLAALVSLMFVIKHFGYNIVARMQLLLASWSGTPKERLYMFWGMNEPSYCLAKDINEQAKKKNAPGSYRTLFIKTEDNDEDTGNRTGLDRLFDFLSLKNKELDKLKELNCLSTTAFSRLSKCELTENDRNNGYSILKSMLGLRRVVKLIYKTTSELHIFIFSEDEDSNIEATSNICHDNDILTFAKDGRKVVIYCHARYDSINRVVEDAQSNGNIEVRIVDSSHNCINELRSKEEYHPINFVTIDTENNIGTVKDSFTSMIVGFGETGQDAARFLYEFGAFVSSDKSSKKEDIPGENHPEIKIERSPFKCHIVDNKMNMIKGRFLASVPALEKGIKEQGDKATVEFHPLDVNSEDFYRLLLENCKNLNYVVVSLKDDELTITTAVRIFNYIRKNRAKLTKFKIFVRCHNSVYEQHMRSIADHYNQILANEHKTDEECIIIYGSTRTLYTYDQIIKNEFEEDGKVYNYAYCEASNEGLKWDDRHKKLLNQNALDSYSKLRRQETQDSANAYHAKTKMILLKKVCEANPKETQHLKKILNGVNSLIPTFHRDFVYNGIVSGIIRADGEFTEMEQLLFRNIARLEHLRWNASHEMLGYQSYASGDPKCELVEDENDNRHSCNERFKLHNCLISWQELDNETNHKNNAWHPDYKLYDFIVITTTLRLYIKNNF